MISPLDFRNILGKNWTIRPHPAKSSYLIETHFTSHSELETHHCATDEQVLAAVKEAKRRALKACMDGLEAEYEKLK